MTPAEAAALYVKASIDGAYVLWFITFGPCAPSCAVAWARVGTVYASTRLRGELVASTIEEFRAMLPARLVRRTRTALMPDGTIEAWD